jgi:hypothetical protein
MTRRRRSPGTAAFAAAWTVQNGVAALPAPLPVSMQFVEALSLT